MSRMGVDQDHEIICKPRVLDARVCSISGGLLRPLEHTVHLIEVDITEQRGDHSTLWNAAVTIGFQHDLQQVHHVIIVDSLRHLGQQPVVPNVVKVAPQIKIYDARLVVNDRLSYAVDRFMCRLLWTVPERSGWKSASKIGSMMSLSAPCTTRSRIAGIERTRTFPPSFGISCFRAGNGL